MILNIGCQEFYENFIDDNAEFGYENLLEKLKYKDIKETEWQQRGSESYKHVNSIAPLTGVPFMDQAPCAKTMVLKERTENKIILEMESTM